jgi:hypothetical protein
MWNALLVSWNVMCAAIGVAYTDIASFVNLVYTDVSSLFAAGHSLIMSGGSYIQNFGAVALKAWGGI